MFDPRDTTCPDCGRRFRRWDGKRCWYCQRQWEERKADFESDRIDDAAIAKENDDE